MSLPLTFHWPKQVMCPRLTSIAGEIHSFSMPSSGERRGIGEWWSAIIYISFLSLSLFLSLLLCLLLFLLIWLSKNQVTYFQNYSTKEPFSLRTPIDKKHSLVNALLLITQNDSHTTPLLHHFAYTCLTYLVLNSDLCALTWDLWFRGHLASPLGTLGLCPPIIFQPCLCSPQHLPCSLVPLPSSLSTSHPTPHIYLHLGKLCLQLQ